MLRKGKWSGVVLNKPKKFWITLAVGICAVAAGAGLSRLWNGQSVPNHTPGMTDTQEHTAEDQTNKMQVENGGQQQPIEITVGEETLLNSAQQLLGKDLPVEQLSAEITAPSDVAFSGTVSKKDAAAMLSAQKDSVSDAYLAVLDLLPDQLPFTLKISLNAADGAAEIIPRSLTIASMEIPDSAMKKEWFDALEQSINQELRKKMQQIDSISVQDSGLLIRGR